MTVKHSDRLQLKVLLLKITPFFYVNGDEVLSHLAFILVNAKYIFILNLIGKLN